MNQQSRITRTQIQGIVSMVFDIAEKYGVEPLPEDFKYAIDAWIIDGKTIDSFPGIPNKRLPVPEINVTQSENCIICDKQIVSSFYPICNDCMEGRCVCELCIKERQCVYAKEKQKS